MSNLQLTPEIKEQFSNEVVEVMKNTFAKDATDSEFVMFAHKAANYGLDPFKNEIFFIKYGTTARIQFAAEAFLSKAREKEGFQPPNTQMVHDNDEFIVESDEDGAMKVTKHKISFPRGKIIGAYSVAYRDNYRPVTVVMDREEISHMFTGANKDNWNKYTADMFGKHVQQRALKRQYGLEFDDETITGGEPVPEYKPDRKDITPEAPAEKNEEDNNKAEPPASENAEEPTQEDQEASEREALTDQIKANFKNLGITNKTARGEFFDEHGVTFEDPQKPTSQEMVGLINIQKMVMEEEKKSDDLS
ncbi:recombinational DNA repair protein RecT [Geomicrobium sp. JCM 19037]|uniref:RecT family recombinase n=1 Tax=Geomicrobium sp. JCM 19037 TaxID=1460634 RepID=UPI00045F32AD|nr:RecT family recombinase [Geomicrobium sp. JCM 19037]GAK05641.1 recombinational DNA repair protein RecT [Geomicrobium sp. JCM 19037]